MSEGAAAGEVTDDALLGGRVRLLQPRLGHRAGTDAVLLAAFADARAGDRVVDLGSASGAAGLMIAARVAGTQIVLLERQEELVALARDNIRRNGFGERASALVFDAFAPSGCAPGEADVVVTNPPWFGGEGVRASPNAGRRAAHVFDGGDLGTWCGTAAGLLRHRGRLCLIHRADALADVLEALGPAFGTIMVRAVYPRAGKDASRVVVSALKGGRSPLRIASALVLHDESGAFTAEAAAHHGGVTPPDQFA